MAASKATELTPQISELLFKTNPDNSNFAWFSGGVTPAVPARCHANFGRASPAQGSRRPPPINSH